MAHLSFPPCDDCQGYGTRLIDPITNQRSTVPCETCKGSGRVRPKNALPPMWEPPAEDGSHDGWLIDPGTDPDLKGVATRAPKHDVHACDHQNCVERRDRGTLPANCLGKPTETSPEAGVMTQPKSDLFSREGGVS